MGLRVPECTLSKGAYSVTIYNTEVTEDFDNKLFTITPAIGKQNQDSGPKDTKVADLLRITRTFSLKKGYLTSNNDKKALIQIIKGAGIKGGAATFTYPDGADATSFSVYVRKAKIKQVASDEPDSPPDDYAKFEVDLTLISGVPA